MWIGVYENCFGSGFIPRTAINAPFPNPSRTSGDSVDERVCLKVKSRKPASIKNAHTSGVEKKTASL